MSLFRRSSLTVQPTKDQPGHSILLNGSSSPSGVKPIPSREPQHIEDASSVFGTSYTSNASTSLSDADAASVGSMPSSASGSASTKVSFAPLPTVPPEMKRRNSITLGVAARKNMLVQQGTAPRVAPNARPPGNGAGRAGGAGGVRQVYMTDEEWEAYKKQYEDKHASDAVDLGELATKGAKNLWRKVRSASTSSVGSNASTTSTSTADSSLAPPQAGDGSMTASSPRGFFKSRKRDASPAGQGAKPPMAADELPTVEEDDREVWSPPAQPIDLTAVNGALGLHRTGTEAAGTGNMDVDLASAAAGSSRGTGAVRRGSFEEWSHSHPAHAGVRAALTAEKHEHEDASGEATPRRRGSPPPHAHAHAHSRLASPPPRTTVIPDEEDEEDRDEAGEEDVFESGAEDEGDSTSEAGGSRISPTDASSMESSPTAVRRRASDFAIKRHSNEPTPSVLGFVRH